MDEDESNSVGGNDEVGEDVNPQDSQMYDMSDLENSLTDFNLQYIENSVIFADLPPELFYASYSYNDNPEVTGQNQMKDEFERMLRTYDEDVCEIAYIKVFRRVRVIFSSSQLAALVKLTLHRSYPLIFNHQRIHVYFVKVPDKNSQTTRLSPPVPDKQFLISPPASPPVGWEQHIEQEPIVNYDLLHAVISLDNEGGTHEIYSGTRELPKIVVHLTPDEEPRPKAKPRPTGPIPHTKRPAPEGMETEECMTSDE